MRRLGNKSKHVLIKRYFWVGLTNNIFSPNILHLLEVISMPNNDYKNYIGLIIILTF